MTAKHSTLVLLTAATIQNIFCQQSDLDVCESEAVGGFASPNGCIKLKMRSNRLRVAFLDVEYVTQNNPAIEKAKMLGLQYSFGQTCEQESTALSEW
jgi:hypothetical protein